MTLRFGTDGVRGVANRELTPELVTALGRAAARVLGTDAALRRRAATRAARVRCSRPRWSPACAPRAPTSCSSGCCPRPASPTSARERGRAGGGDLRQPQPVRRQRRSSSSPPGGRKIPETLEREVEQELRALAVSQPEPGPEGVGRRRVERAPRRARRLRRHARRRAAGPPARRPARRASTAATAPRSAPRPPRCVRSARPST